MTYWYNLFIKYYSSPQLKIYQKNNKNQLILAIQAIQNNPELYPRVAARIYSVDYCKLGCCLYSIYPQYNILANLQKLTNLEEEVLVQHILDLDIKGFPPWVPVVEEMANRLLATRDSPRVGTRWAYNFVNWRPELRTRFQWKYDY